jgi:hypothetical protein
MQGRGSIGASVEVERCKCSGGGATSAVRGRNGRTFSRRIVAFKCHRGIRYGELMQAHMSHFAFVLDLEM